MKWRRLEDSHTENGRGAVSESLGKRRKIAAMVSQHTGKEFYEQVFNDVLWKIIEKTT